MRGYWRHSKPLLYLDLGSAHLVRGCPEWCSECPDCAPVYAINPNY